MQVFLVTWNLNKERANYDAARIAFVKHLDLSYQNKADSGLESVRFVASTQTADAISAHLYKRLDGNDCLVVTKMNAGQHQGWLSEETWEWINRYL